MPHQPNEWDRGYRLVIRDPSQIMLRGINVLIFTASSGHLRLCGKEGRGRSRRDLIRSASRLSRPIRLISFSLSTMSLSLSFSFSLSSLSLQSSWSACDRVVDSNESFADTEWLPPARHSSRNGDKCALQWFIINLASFEGDLIDHLVAHEDFVKLAGKYADFIREQSDLVQRGAFSLIYPEDIPKRECRFRQRIIRCALRPDAHGVKAEGYGVEGFLSFVIAG